MELLRKCMYCNTIARFTCKLCAAGVCEAHYDKHLGICIHCRGKQIKSDLKI